MTVKSVFRIALASLLLVAEMVHLSDAFSVTPQHKSRNASPSTSAIGYTMQMPEFAVNLPKSTWYDVANPTDRRIVYDDGPTEFTFASIGSNWPEVNDIPEKEETLTKQTPEQTRQPWSRFNPIRGARNLIRRVL
mmetsp:Transcript_5783/g.14350  ORF Transcript_5783/g.14350 Transcript_5783/m.14350 type:complete len:135 (-) Transcript_5783:218-622(-)